MGDIVGFGTKPSGPTMNEIPPAHALQRDDWSQRRLRLDLTLFLLAGLLSYIVLANKANAVDQLVVPALVAGICSLVAAYVFGAAWDYKTFMTSMSSMANGMPEPDGRDRY